MVVLKPLADAVGLERVIISSYQAVSGTGAGGIAELRRETEGYLAGDEPAPEVYPHPIAFNVLPHIDVFDETGYTGEERKVIAETQKMLGMPDLAVSATCVRVPVFNGHSVSVQIETTEALSADHARGLLMGAPGLILADEPELGIYPFPRLATGRDEVMVGRIRKDLSHPRGAWCCGSRATTCARARATNAVQIAESLVTRGWL